MASHRAHSAKDTEPGELLRGLRAVAGGDALRSPSVTHRLIGEYAAHVRSPAISSALDELTLRKREVVAVAAKGLPNQAIAERLYISPATARTHVSRAMNKLGARDRPQLVVLAYETSPVRPGWS